MKFLRITAALSLILACAQLSAAQTNFAERCLGTWGGVMSLYRDGVVRDTVPVRLTVARTKKPDEYTWKTEYISKTMPAVKDYILRVKDAAKGQYVIDEGGGVQLMEYVFADKMYDVFETGGVMQTSSIEIRGKELIFEVTAGKKLDGDGSVSNYSVSSVQRVVYRRIKSPAR